MVVFLLHFFLKMKNSVHQSFRITMAVLLLRDLCLNMLTLDIALILLIPSLKVFIYFLLNC